MKSWGMARHEWKQLFQRTFHQFQDDDMAGEAAKLAFYLIFAIFPFLLSLTALLGIVLQGDSLLKEAINDYFTRVAPYSVAELVSKTLTEVTNGAKAQKFSFGLVISVWAASRGMLGLMRALNVAYEVREGRKWWKARLVALGLTLSIVLLMALALFLILVGGPWLVQFSSRIGFREPTAWVWNILRWPAALAFLLFAFNFIYIYAPNLRRRRWHNLMPGTVIGVFLWLFASLGFKLYLSHFNNYSATYGSIGAVITLLMWLYVSAAAILIGAEINSELEIDAQNVSQKES